MRRFLLGTLALVMLAGALAYGAVGWVMVDEAVTAERVPLEGTPALVGLAYEDVSFPPRSDDEWDRGLTLRGWYIPAGADPAKGTLVLVHGVDSNRAREAESYLPVARGLHNAGFNLLLFDLRAHGESDGDIFSGGFFERRDIWGALDFVTQEKSVRWERVGVLGYSLGAVGALLAAVDEPRLRAVVSDSAYADVNDLIVKETADRTPLTPATASLLQPGMIALARLRYGIDLGYLVPERAVAALDFPLLIIHSAQDERFDVDYARRLKAASAHPDTELWISPTGEHSRIYQEDLAEYVRRVSAYFVGRFVAMETSP